MTDAAGQQLTTLSVRGRAERTVAPDVAQLWLTARAVQGSAPSARSALTAVVERVRGRLAGLGAVALSAGTGRADLAWSVRSIQVGEDTDWSGGRGPRGTGRFLAAAEMTVLVRDFAVMPAVLEQVTQDDGVELENVAWSVDEDNAAWASVRGDAINSAIETARDYALALRGRLLSVEHVADAGLLRGGSRSEGHELVAMAARGGVGGDGGGAAPSLDPVPQTVSAVIEARFVATADAPA